MKPSLSILLLVAGLIVTALLAITNGSVDISLTELFQTIANKTGLSDVHPGTKVEAIIWGIRLPRVILSLLVGSVMGICGAAMQGLFRNPLADPSIIGISAGASLAAALVIVLGTSFFAPFGIYVQLSALAVSTFSGAVLATLLIFSLSVAKGKAIVASMLLTGIAINAFSMAFVGLLTFLSTESQLRTLTFWTLGSLGGANWTGVSIMAIIFLIVIIGLLRQYKSLNLLALGENEAKFLGISTESLKRRVLLFTALGVGFSVSQCGMISFVGLVVPHLVRLSLGSDNRLVLPVSAIGGALLLCGADLISRIISPPVEIPIGVITALIGAPFFLFLLHQQKKKSIVI